MNLSLCVEKPGERFHLPEKSTKEDILLIIPVTSAASCKGA
jgi:hypothetical protein